MLRSLIAVTILLATSCVSCGGTKKTNTNSCIAAIGTVAAPCGAYLATNTGLEACCDVLDDWVRDRCDCNPTIDLLVGPTAGAIFGLEGVCRASGFGYWGPRSPRHRKHLPAPELRTCSSAETHHYRCEAHDMQMDRDRLASIFSLGGVSAAAAADCLNVTLLYERMSLAFTKDVYHNSGYGGGTYIGAENVAEYYSIVFPKVNRDMWYRDGAYDVPSLPMLSDDGSTWYITSETRHVFLGGLLNKTIAIDNSFSYRACETKISTYLTLPNEGLRDLVEFLVQTADFSKKYGVEEICRYHEEYCAPNNATKQYESEQACIDYMRTLPVYTDACGINRPLAGNSVSCKLKHHFMLPANPALHCPHIGPAGTVDANGDYKCDDVAECSTDIGQDSWPLMGNIGEDTPAEIRAIFEAHNVGFEQEELPCVEF